MEYYRGMEGQSDESRSYLNKSTGEVVLISDQEFRRDAALREIAIEWCEDNNIESTERE